MDNFSFENRMGEKDEAVKDYWTRISEEALKILALKNKNSEYVDRAKILLSDEKFKQHVKKIWKDQDLRETQKEIDIAEREKSWAEGLAIRLQEELKKE